MLNIAIQAAKVASKVAPVAAKAAPYAVPAAKIGGTGIAFGIVLNELGRLSTKALVKYVQDDSMLDDLQLEKFETHVQRPTWKKLTWTRADETFGQGVARRGRVLWDIVLYGLGETYYTLNFFTVKIVKLAAWLLGKALYLAGYALASVGIGFAYGVSSMRMQTFANAEQATARWLDAVTMKPFEGVRWIDRQNEMIAWRLKYRRSAATLYREMFPEWFNGLATEEVVIDGLISGDTEVDVETRREQDADINHLVVALTADERRAKANPKMYGRNLAKDIFEKASKNLAAVESFRGELGEHCKAMQLTDRQSALVFQGYEEAMVRLASENATS